MITMKSESSDENAESTQVHSYAKLLIKIPCVTTNAKKREVGNFQNCCIHGKYHFNATFEEYSALFIIHRYDISSLISYSKSLQSSLYITVVSNRTEL